MKRLAGLVAVVALCVVVSNLRGADEKKAAPPQGQPSAAEMMAMMEKLGAPNENHKRLEMMVGEFKGAVKTYFGPEPEVSVGMGRNEMVFGGRWLKSDYSGTMMGKPFKGIQFLGYDNQKKKYVTVWIDEMSTGMMTAEGEMDGAGKVLTMTSECVDPMSNQKQTMRLVTTIVDKDHHRFEMFGPGPDGKEMLTMSIDSTRVK